MNILLDSMVDFLLYLNLFITCFLLFFFCRRKKARSKDDENDLNEPVTDVASENCEMEQSANVLNEELDRHVEQEQKPIQIAMLVQIEREKPKSGLYVEYTAEMKFRVNEENVQMYKPTLKKTVNAADAGMNAVQSFIMKNPMSVICHVDNPYIKNQSKEPAMAICIENNDIFTRFNEIAAHTTSDFLLRKSMKTLFTLFSLAFIAIIVQGGEEIGRKVEPLPCKDRGSKASCNRYMKKDNFEELCKENRRIGRYLCCKTCAEKLGVEVNEDGKFKDFGTFTYYEPTCPALEDRGNHTICEMIKHGSEVYKCDQSEAQAACAKTCNLTSVRMCTPVGKILCGLPHLNVIKIKGKAIVYKAPAQDTGKIIHAGAVGNWDNGQAPFTNSQGHSFAKTLEHVVGDDRTIKFLAYNNVPPGIPNVKTKSNSKGVIILSTAADSAAWVIHTIPGFPTAKTPYAWPASETARGHLLICLTISKSQINAIETAGMPYFKKLAEGQTPIIPPFTSRRTIRSQNAAAPVTVHIYSKSESSKYEIYKKVIVKALKKTIKVWSRRDNKLKGDCRVPGRYIRLLQSPGVINGHNTNIEADDTNWAVSDPGNKNQSKEPAMAICIENNDIFTRFNEIAAQARRKDDENDLNEPVTDVASENCEMEESANVLNEELDRHVEQEQKPIQIAMLVQIEREKPKSGLYVEYTAEMKFRVNEENVQMYKPTLKKTVNVADAGKNQSKEPAMAICIENNDIFRRFNEIAAQNEYSPGRYRRFSAIFEPFHHMLLVVFLLPQARSKDDENDLNEPVTDVASENCEMEESANVLNEELDRHVEQEQKPIQIAMLVQIEREKPKSGLYVEYTAEMKFRVNEENVQMYKPTLKKTVNAADAGMNAKNQSKEPAMAICIENNDIFTRFNEIAAHVENSL
ncbi:Deoxyribonuclease-2-alpha [Trichinella britovi]|uniref:Deoxyribonuclease-2-alpha n=1 Tax=Trichinella britovi TaxID=45882 RepID=A0A0V1CC75_TRIBR|nr:Deoxyribonuclease-2-alpha [Trichinella britovi]